jgi:hypothetical protein
VVIFARKTKRAVAATALGTVASSTVALAYALGRRHGRASAMAQFAQQQMTTRRR